MRGLAVLFWLAALASLALLAPGFDPHPGWDTLLFREAMQDVAHGQDPYRQSLMRESAYLALRARQQGPAQVVPCVSPPCPYVYTPLTLPVLHQLGRLPAGPLDRTYKLLYLLATIAAPLSLLTLARPGPERTVFALLAPGMLFFPGLVLNFVVFSGNMAYPLYGLMLPCAVLGWRRRLWWPFLLFVLLASCCKPPLLTLLALPLLTEATTTTAGVLFTVAAGMALFLAQALLWPQLFGPYLQALDMLFRQDADFGVSPAGQLGTLLHLLHRSYTPWTTLAYLAYAPVLAWVLWRLRGAYLAGHFTRQSWLPMALLGTLLLNPRVKEYDLAAMTMPMALVAWRLCGHGRHLPKTALGFAALLTSAGLLSRLTTMQITYGLLLVGLFVGGVWQLSRAVVPQQDGDAPLSAPVFEQLPS